MCVCVCMRVRLFTCVCVLAEMHPVAGTIIEQAVQGSQHLVLACGCVDELERPTFQRLFNKG